MMPTRKTNNMGSIFRVTYIASAALFFCAASVVAADSGTDRSLANRITQRAEALKQYRDLLANPDQNIRLAALDEMTKSDSPTVRELAYKIGFSSPDETMRSLALYSIFSRRLSEVIVHVTNMDAVPESFAKTFGSRLALGIRNFDHAKGQFVVATPWPGSRGGQVSGLSVVFTKGNRYEENPGCNLNLHLEDGAILKGEMLCGGFSGPVQVTIKLM